VRWKHRTTTTTTTTTTINSPEDSGEKRMAAKTKLE